jgi:hypothetical protein
VGAGVSHHVSVPDGDGRQVPAAERG